MMFEPGQLVICVDAESYEADRRPCVLERGRVYTVRDFWPSVLFRVTPQAGVRLCELCRLNCAIPFFPEDDAPWGACRFRPVRDSDIAIFREALTKAPEAA